MLTQPQVERPRSSSRGSFLLISMAGILLLRCLQLQGWQGTQHERTFRQLGIVSTRIPAQRGRIEDLRGTPLLWSEQRYQVRVRPRALRTAHERAQLATLLDVSEQALEARAAFPLPTWTLLRRDAPWTASAALQRSSLRPFLSITPRWHRASAGPWVSALGFLSEAVSPQTDPLPLGELHPHGGLEAFYDPLLRGSDGIELREYSSQGRLLRTATQLGAVPGVALRTSLDGVLLQRIDEAFRAHNTSTGTAIVLHARTGRVLALRSYPSIDPELFSRGFSADAWRSYADQAWEHRNRALQSTWYPALTLSPFLVLATSHNDAVANEHTSCNGRYYYGRRSIVCPRVHGALDVYEAIEQQCASQVLQFAEHLPQSKWVDALEELGFGSRTGLDANSEYAGALHRHHFFARALHIPSRRGLAGVTATPMQIAVAWNTLASNARWIRPRIAWQTRGIAPMEELLPEERTLSWMSSSAIDAMRVALRRRVESPMNVEHAAEVPGLNVAGLSAFLPYDPPDGTNAATAFVGFAPSDDPEITVLVVTEDEKYNRELAAQIAGRIFDEWQHARSTWPAEFRTTEALP